MENATKALLIAAAILISILVISLGLYVYRMASDTVGSANLSEAELGAFNGKFEAGAGTRVSGASVNALLTTIASSNSNPDNATRQVTVTDTNATGAAVTAAGQVTKVNTGRYYSVQLTYTNGLVSNVSITGL